MRRLRVGLGLVSFLIGSSLIGAACTRETTPSGTSRTVPRGAGTAESGATAPAGTTFSATLDEGLSSTTATPGQSFTLKVKTPLLAPSGEVVAESGATIRGHVVSVARPGAKTDSAPVLRVDFDRIDTSRGATELYARITGGDEDAFVVGDPDELGGSLLYPTGAQVGIGGEPTAPDQPRPTAFEIVLPAGYEIRLVLARPLTRP
jgi:hypothetical protein